MPLQAGDVAQRAITEAKHIVVRSLQHPSAIPEHIAWQEPDFTVESEDEHEVKLLFRYRPSGVPERSQGYATYNKHSRRITRLSMRLRPCDRPDGFDAQVAQRLCIADSEAIVLDLFHGRLKSGMAVRAALTSSDRESHRYTVSLEYHGKRVFMFGGVVYIDAFSGLPTYYTDNWRYVPAVPAQQGHVVDSAEARMECLRILASLPPMSSMRVVSETMGWSVPAFTTDLNEMTSVHHRALDELRIVPVYWMHLCGRLQGRDLMRDVVVDAHTGRGLAVRDWPGFMLTGSGGPVKPRATLEPGEAKLAFGGGTVAVTLVTTEPIELGAETLTGYVERDGSLLAVSLSGDGATLKCEGRFYRLGVPLSPDEVKRLRGKPFGT